MFTPTTIIMLNGHIDISNCPVSLPASACSLAQVAYLMREASLCRRLTTCPNIVSIPGVLSHKWHIRSPRLRDTTEEGEDKKKNLKDRSQGEPESTQQLWFAYTRSNWTSILEWREGISELLPVTKNLCTVVGFWARKHRFLVGCGLW